MKWGYNWEIGPFETWDAVGVKESVAKMEKDGLTIPENIKKMLKKKATSFYKLEKGKKMFYDFASESYKPVKTSPKALSLVNFKAEKKWPVTSGSCSLIDIGDGVFCLEFHSKMNAINKEMVDFMAKAGWSMSGSTAWAWSSATRPAACRVHSPQAATWHSCWGSPRPASSMRSTRFIRNVHKGIMGTQVHKLPRRGSTLRPHPGRRR